MPIPVVLPPLLGELAAREPAASVGTVLTRLQAVLDTADLERHFSAPVPVTDALVAAAAAHSPATARALAGNPTVTPHQLAVLVEGLGDTSGVFAPPPAPGTDVGRSHALRSGALGVAEVVAALGADPALAYTARALPHDLGPLLYHLDEPWASIGAVPGALRHAVQWGAVTPAELCARVRPALVGVQVLAKLTREEAALFSEDDADALLRPLLAGALGADAEAWSRFASLLAASEVALPEALASAASGPAGSSPRDTPEPTPLRIPGRVRPAVLFLLRRLDTDLLSALLPHLDDSLAAELIPGDVPPRPGMIGTALATRSRAMLVKLAGHQHLRTANARLLMALEDRDVDIALAANRTGVPAAVRTDVLAGISAPGRPRRPLDPALRLWAVGEPQRVEAQVLAMSGDPALVCLGLAGAPRLRRVDEADALLAVWDRAGAEGLEGVLTSLPPTVLNARVRKAGRAAVAAGDVGPLSAERERLAGMLKPRQAADRRSEPWRWPAEERLRELPLDERGYQWVRAAVQTGGLDAARLVDTARPALWALAAVADLAAYRAADGALPALSAEVAGVLGSDPEAWAVFVQLVPEFTGTAAELAAVCSAATAS